MLDTVHEISTPELIQLRLHCAGPVPRALAWLVDFLIRMGIVLVASMVLALLGHMGMGIFFILMFVIEWLYPVFFEVLQGATPGKRALGLIVVHLDGSPVGWGASFIRNLLRAVDFLPVLYAVGLISMLLSRQSQRLGDIVAGTRVVYARQAAKPPKVPDAPLWRSPVPLNGEAQRAILAFAERAPVLSAERAAELAGHAAHLTAGARDEVAVQRLYGLARAIMGRKG